MLFDDLLDEGSSEEVDEEGDVETWVEKEEVACYRGEGSGVALFDGNEG